METRSFKRISSSVGLCFIILIPLAWLMHAYLISGVNFAYLTLIKYDYYQYALINIPDDDSYLKNMNPVRAYSNQIDILSSRCSDIW